MKNNSKKKSSIILLLIILFVLLTGAGAAYANKDALINSYYRIMKSPREYYVYLEKHGLYELLSALPNDEDSGEVTYAYDISSNISFHKNELNSILDTVLGTNLTDLEKLLGISLDNVGLDLLLASENYMHNETITLKLNDTKLLTAELFLDSVAQRMSLRFPELSDAYLTQSLGEAKASTNTYELQQKLLHTDLSEQILSRYIELYFNNLGTVTLEQKVSLSLDKTDIECNVLTVNFTQEEARELYLTLLETAKTDEDILFLLPLLNMTKAQYLQSLDKISEIISGNHVEENQEAVLQMKLYVDGNGRILSREINTLGKPSFGYTFLAKEDYLEYELQLSHASTNRVLRISGTNRKIDEYNQGEATLNVKNPSLISDSDIDIDITYEDVKSISYEKQHYLEGTFTLSSEKLTGIQITSAFSFKDNQQLNTTAIRLGASPFIIINSTGMPLTDYEVIRPDHSDSLHDFLEYNKYLSEIDFEGYLTSLTDSLGIKREVLTDLLRYSIEHK